MAARVKSEDSMPLEESAQLTEIDAHHVPSTTRSVKHEPEGAAAVAEHDLTSDDGMGELYIEIELRASEDSATSGANAHHAPRIARTIKHEPESAAVAAEAGLMSDDGFEEVEVKSEPSERHEAVNGCLDCRTTTAKKWISGKRWNQKGKLCGSCYEHRRISTPKIIVYRQCLDCGVDGSTCKQWRSWNAEWLCTVCYAYRRCHEGTARPMPSSTLPVSTVDHCHDCGTEEPKRSQWTHGTRWGIHGKLCNACYGWRARNNGEVKPRVTKFQCAKCGSVMGKRWFNGVLMGLQGVICTRCEYARRQPGSRRRPEVPDCADCHTKEAGSWKSGARWGINGLLCNPCYHYRRNHKGQSRVFATVATQDDEGDAANGENEADETVPPPAKRRRTTRGKAAVASTTATQ